MIKKKIVYASAVVYRDIEHWGSLESTQEARGARGKLLRLFRALQTSQVHNISTYARWRMN